jgi:hypothetical protein
MHRARNYIRSEIPYYVANGSGDLAVWCAARKAVLINPSVQLLRMVSRVTEVQDVFEDRRAPLRDYVNALRPAHWLKNCLVFVALFDRHIFNDPVLLGKALLAFVALCLCTSSGWPEPGMRTRRTDYEADISRRSIVNHP